MLTNQADRAGVVEIDLSAVAAEASRRLEERSITSLADVSGRPLMITLVESDSIAQLQGAFTVFDGVALTLSWIAIVLYAAAVYVATDRRRAVARVGTGIIAGALGLLIVLAVARSAYLGRCRLERRGRRTKPSSTRSPGSCEAAGAPCSPSEWSCSVSPSCRALDGAQHGSGERQHSGSIGQEPVRVTTAWISGESGLSCRATSEHFASPW